MKLSIDTINILKNFASINTNILFREGNALNTISTSKSVFAHAKVVETFPCEFGVYDLNNLLSLLTLMEDQDIDFGEKSLTITKDNGKFEYFYSSPNILVVAPNKTIEYDEHYTFALTEKEIQLLLKAVSVVGATTISVIADGSGPVNLVVGDRKDNTSNSYTKLVGMSQEAFECHVQVTNFIIIPDNYTITLSKKKLMHLKAETKSVEYYLAMEPDSRI